MNNVIDRLDEYPGISPEGISQVKRILETCNDIRSCWLLDEDGKQAPVIMQHKRLQGKKKYSAVFVDLRQAVMLYRYGIDKQGQHPQASCSHVNCFNPLHLLWVLPEQTHKSNQKRTLHVSLDPDQKRHQAINAFARYAHEECGALSKRNHCTSLKMAFPTYEGVQKAINLYNNDKRISGTMEMYRCVLCGMYHMTSSGSRKRKSRRTKRLYRSQIA